MTEHLLSEQEVRHLIEVVAGFSQETAQALANHINALMFANDRRQREINAYHRTEAANAPQMRT